jgi:hypothetical protein
MLIIAYPRDPAFLALTPFIKLDPQLVVIDRLLQDRKLILLTANDLALSAPHALWNGRPSTPVVVTLRVAVMRRLTNWTWRTLEKESNGSVQWRWFCTLEAHRCPHYSTLRDREALIQPKTLHRLNDRVVRLAQREGVTQGKKCVPMARSPKRSGTFPRIAGSWRTVCASLVGPWRPHGGYFSHGVAPINYSFVILIVAPNIWLAKSPSARARRKGKKHLKIRHFGSIGTWSRSRKRASLTAGTSSCG